MTLFILLLLQKTPLFTSHDGVSQGGSESNPVSTGYHPVLIRWVYILMLSKHLLPPRTITLISLFIIVTYTTITIPLTETTYIVVIIIVTIDSVSSSLTVTSHNTITVIVPCNSICSTLTKSLLMAFPPGFSPNTQFYFLTFIVCLPKRH